MCILVLPQHRLLSHVIIFIKIIKEDNDPQTLGITVFTEGGNPDRLANDATVDRLQWEFFEWCVLTVMK